MSRIALSAPVPRVPLHTRTIECRGYRRDDALYDIEGHLVDVKSVAFHNMDRGEVRAGEPIHEMWIRLTVDLNLHVVDVEAQTVWGPYAACGDITPNFKRLKGLTIKQGGHKKHAHCSGASRDARIWSSYWGRLRRLRFRPCMRIRSTARGRTARK